MNGSTGPSPDQARVLACLVEKSQTTPDSYPLTTNALRSACNQATNRDPVVDYSERDVDARMLELREMGFARTITGSGHRVNKHRHILDDALSLDGHELAVLAVLLLRGPQTFNEIVTRTERYGDGPHGDRAAVDAAVDRLAARTEPLVTRRERRAGEREPRIEQLWVPAAPTSAEDGADGVRGHGPDPAIEGRSISAQVRIDAPADPRSERDLHARVAALESALAEQTRRLDELIDQLGE